MEEKIKLLFSGSVQKRGNLLLTGVSGGNSSGQTQEVFSEKWLKNPVDRTIDGIRDFQLKWYLQLYGFDSEEKLGEFLKDRKVIFDAGCGLGYKAAWFARLAPESVVIGMDYSDAVIEAADYYKDIENLFFVRGDISDTGLKGSSVNYISCDQVIHHTDDPENTFNHLCSLLSGDGEISCYVYARKALPRELLDEHFRALAPACSKEELWEFSEQVTQLGKNLSEIGHKVRVPDIPLLGIKGGEYDIQRFLYWNFLKCFWNKEFGWENSVLTNFDWYSPSKASRYSEDEFRKWILNNGLITRYFHKEEACYSGRFVKPRE